jgi:prevent-host-death family protein
METSGAYEAKTHLPHLLDRVARDERITITRRGVPVAMLIPVRLVKARGTSKSGLRVPALGTNSGTPLRMLRAA